MGLPTYKLAALQELESRERAAQSLPHYAAYTLDVVPAAHHVLICSAIQDLLEDRYDELIINSPPGSAKSTYTSHALPAYFLGHYPDKNVILATHTSDLSERWSRKVRNTLNSSRHRNVFPKSELSQDSTSVSRWATRAGGELLAAGVGGSILGFRADLGVLDDPISGYEQAQSLTQLQKIHSWYETDFVTRLKPDAKVVLICQRLSPNDLAGYLIARNEANPTRRQRLLILRMEAHCTCGGCAEGAARLTCDPLGRTPGERLWPEWYTPEMVADAKRDDFKWRTLYQQRPPSDEGSWVSTEEIQFRPTPGGPGISGGPGTYYGMSDLALSVNTGDYSVHLIVAIDTNGDWDIVDAARERVDPDQSASRVVSLCETYSPTEWLIDDDNASKVFGPLVATAARQRGVTVPWKTMPMRGQNKETRAAPLRGMFKRRKVYMPANAHFTPWLTKELLTFPNAIGQGVDDGVDALGLLGRRLLAIAIPSNVVPIRRLPTIQEMTLDQLFEDMPSIANSRI
jgi:predicted phage terminase large subunit-like protein